MVSITEQLKDIVRDLGGVFKRRKLKVNATLFQEDYV